MSRIASFKEESIMERKGNETVVIRMSLIQTKGLSNRNA
jgi:hypothetical protein